MDEEILKKALAQRGVTIEVRRIECGSTNVYASENPVEKDTLFFTHEQSGGRGRGEKSFVSKKGGIYMTLVLAGGACESPAHLPLFAALAVTDALKDCGVKAGVKWPNDIILNGKKLCGILCKKTSANNAVIGIGINVYNDIGEVKDVAVSFFEAGYSCEQEALAAAVISNIYRYTKNDFGEFLNLYRTRCISLGEKLYFSETREYGKAVAIDDEGFLIAEVNGEKRRIVNPVT